MSFQPIRTTVAVLTSAALITGAAYYRFPVGYAAVAYKTGWLPVTEKIKADAPDLWYHHQLGLLNQADRRLTASRDRMQRNRLEIEEQRQDYAQRLANSEELLKAARHVYRASPSAATFEFVGKKYSAAAFSTQVEVLDEQAKAVRQSIESLDQAQAMQDRVWAEVAKKQAQIDADKARLSTAQILWETRQLLSGLDVDTDLAEVEQIADLSQYELRTVEELIADAGVIAVREKSRQEPAQTATGGLSPKALAILGE